jgi:hypothetical protein
MIKILKTATKWYNKTINSVEMRLLMVIDVLARQKRNKNV